MTASLRIAIAANGGDAFALIHSKCTEAGHTPVAYVLGRTYRPGQVIRPVVGERVAKVLDTLPPGMDVLLPGSAVGLASALPGYRADLVVCYGFPWKIPAEVLRIPRLGIMNIHPSLLPKYRGPLPIPWAIRNGDPEFGMTIHWMDEGFDTGRIIVQQSGIPLDDEINPSRLVGQIHAVIDEILPVALERAAEGFPGEPQNEADASYAGWMEPEFSRIEWSRTAMEIHNQVRAARFFSETNGPVANVEGTWVKIQRTRTKPGVGSRVECADGPLWIVESAPTAPPVSQ